MFRRGWMGGTRITKTEGVKEEFGLRLKWVSVVIVAIDAVIACIILGALLLGPVSLAVLSFVVVLAFGMALGAIERWNRRWAFRGSAVGAAMVTGAVFANRDEIWGALFGQIAAGMERLTEAVQVQIFEAWPLGVVLFVVWFLVAWKVHVGVANWGALSAVVAYVMATVAEMAPLVELVWSRLRYILLVFLWPIPVAAAVLVVVAVQEVFMPNASITVQPATVDEWKTLGPLGLGFLFKRLRTDGKAPEPQVIEAESYQVETKDGGNFDYDRIPFPKIGGARGLARYYAAVLAGKATISEGGSKARAGEFKRYEGALAYGYSALQWRSGFVDESGNVVPSLRDALYKAGLVEKKGVHNELTEKGIVHAARFVADHLGMDAVPADHREYLELSETSPANGEEG